MIPPAETPCSSLIPFNGFDTSVVGPVGPLALTLSRLELLGRFVTIVDAALGLPAAPEVPRGRDEPLTAATLAGLRGASAATFIVPALALTERVTGRPTAPDAVAGLDIPTFVAVVVAVVAAALVELLTDVLDTVRLMIFRVVLLPLVGRGALALVVIFRVGGALAR